MSHISRQIRQKTNEQGSETKRVKREREGLVGVAGVVFVGGEHPVDFRETRVQVFLSGSSL